VYVLSNEGTSDRADRVGLLRILGKGDLWITEYTITCQGRTAYTVSIMEFRNGKVVHETQYFRRSLRRAGLAKAMGSPDRLTPH
jgi:hypothetical protein